MKNILFFGLALIVLSACSKPSSLILEGKVKRETISIAPKYAGRIVKLYVTEGSTVKAGDTLAVLDIPEVEAKKQQAEGALHAATWQYNMALHGATKEQKEQVEAAWKAARDQVEFAEKSLARIRNMYNDSLVSPQAYDEALTKCQMARAQYEAATAKRQEVLGGLRDEQVQMALGQKKQAEGAVQEATVVMGERVIIAPKDMTIETLALHEGELALPGYNIIIGYDPSTTWFRFTASESIIQQFTKGNEYEVTLLFENKSMNTKLTAINELAKYGARTSAYPNYQPGEAVYELKLVPDDKQAANHLFTNYSVRLEIK